MKFDALSRPSWHENIRELCREGVEAVREGRYDAVRFSVFGLPERDMVIRVMRDIGEGVPYIIDTATATPDQYKKR